MAVTLVDGTCFDIYGEHNYATKTAAKKRIKQVVEML